MPPHEFLRQRESRFASRYLAKLAHPAFIGHTIEHLNRSVAAEDDESEDQEDNRELLDLVYGQPLPTDYDSDPLDFLFQNAYSRARSTEQLVALRALQKLHRVALPRGEHNELLHVRNLTLTILSRPQPPQGPQSAA